MNRRGCLASVVIWLLGCRGGRLLPPAGDLQSADVEVRRKAAQALAEHSQLNEGEGTALLTALDDPDQEVRRWACRGLGKHCVTRAQTALEERLHDPETPVRRAAAFALQQIAPDSTAYRQEIMAAMRSGDGGVIVSAAKWQPPSVWAADTLVRLLTDRRPGIRRIAADALGQIGHRALAVTAALERAKTDSDDRVRESATAALARLVPEQQ